MSATSASDRIEAYGAAILELARAEGQSERVEQELFTIARTFATSNEFRDALTNPQLPVERKQAIIDDLVSGRATSLTTGLVSLIVAVGRAADLTDIVNSFIARAAASRARAVAEVRSAVPLEPELVERLTAALNRATGKDLEVKVIVDPTVVGGIVARIGDTIIDGSVASRLANLRDVLRSA